MLTKHATRRMDQRVGINAKAAARLAGRALEIGIRREELNGALARWLEWLYLRGTGVDGVRADNIRIYGEHVYIFVGSRLLTVMHVPPRLKVPLARARRRLGR